MFIYVLRSIKAKTGSEWWHVFFSLFYSSFYRMVPVRLTVQWVWFSLIFQMAGLILLLGFIACHRKYVCVSMLCDLCVRGVIYMCFSIICICMYTCIRWNGKLWMILFTNMRLMWVYFVCMTMRTLNFFKLTAEKDWFQRKQLQ